MALDGFDKWAPSWTSVDGLAAPTRAPATHASVAASIPRHNGAADGTAWRVAHVNQVLQRVGGVVVAGNHAAGKTEPRLCIAIIGVLRLRRARSGRTSAKSRSLDSVRSAHSARDDR